MNFPDLTGFGISLLEQSRCMGEKAPAGLIHDQCWCFSDPGLP